MKWKIVVVVGVAAVAFKSVETWGQSSSSCGLDTLTIQQSNVKCQNMNSISQVASFSQCCANGNDQDQQRGDDDSTCRQVEMSQAYCPSPDNCDVDKNDELRVTLDMSSDANSADSCCSKCSCYGDPDCVAFSGETDEWVVCDARKEGSCEYSESLCKSMLDPSGEHNCKWVKKEKWWKSFAQSGGPCQPDFSRPGFEYPTMVMHKRGAFELVLTLGERGVIVQIDMSTSDGEFRLTSDNCFSDGASAWEVVSGTQPSGWVSSSNSAASEIRWLASDSDLGINVDIVCARLGRSHNGQTRIDIRALLDTSTDGSDPESFCTSGEIEKTGTTDNTGKHLFCTDKALPPLDHTCRGIWKKKCPKGSKKQRRKAEEWCDKADLTQTTASSPEECKSLILGDDADDNTVARNWITLICEINKIDELMCKSLISQFGLGDFLEKYSNGLNDGTTPNTCVSDSTLYTTSDHDCRDGINVEYYMDDQWHQAFFIPSNAPPCNGELVVNGADKGRDVLFKYPIRFSQCDLKVECLAVSDCMPTPSFTVTTDFSTQNCPEPTPSPTSRHPTPSPTTPAPTVPRPGPDCYTCDEQNQEQQTICDDNDSTPLTAGSCETCCVSEDILNPYEPGTVCREVALNQAYCDASLSNDMKKKCNSLSKKNGKLTVNLFFDESSDSSCCNTCTLFGDPFGRAFNGNYEKWILCDARGDDCWVNKDICASKVDYDGVQCAWNQGIMDKLTKRGDIGAYGSPCQSVSKPWLTMYELDGFKVETSTGERAVIDDVKITTGGEVFQLMADSCFERNIWAAWDRSDVTDHLEVSMETGPGSDARTWTIVDPDTNVFIKAVCIRKVAKSNKRVKGYRINVETLISLNDDPKRSKGFCASGSIDEGRSSANNETLINMCDQSMDDAIQICKALWHKSVSFFSLSPLCRSNNSENQCILAQFAQGAEAWCSMANLYPSDPNRIQTCINKIQAWKSDTNAAANRWAGEYCKAIQAQKPPGVSEDIWIQQCRSRMEVDGYEVMVDQYGQGTYMTNKRESNCGMDESYYGKKTSAQDCTAGISVEYLKNGKWEEELFIPSYLPPCLGSLELTARRHMNLFVYPVRFRQCEIDLENCPMDVNCMPDLGYEIKYLFSQDADVCQR